MRNLDRIYIFLYLSFNLRRTKRINLIVEGKQGTKLEDLARNDFVLRGKTT